MKKTYPCLWFDREAKQAAEYYVSIFPRSRVKGIAHHTATTAKASRRKKGSVLAVWFELDGRPFLALNGGPQFRFTEAVSLVVPCRDQKEIDRYWRLLSRGGEEGVCGWLKDRYGLSWQVVPEAIPRMLSEGDARQVERVMAAVMEMTKLDLARLRRACAGR